MKLHLFGLLAGLLVATSTATEEHHLRRSLANEDADEGGDYNGVTPQTAEEARSEDIAIIANTNGWRVEDTERHMDLQDAFKGLVGKLKKNNRFSESIMAEAPGANPKILFKNGVPKNLEAEIASFETENDVKVERVATKFSRKDQENRVKRIKNKLRAKKFGDMTLAVIGDALKISAQKPIDDDKIKPTPPGRGDIPPGQVDKVAAKILGLDHNDDELYGLQLDIYPGDAEIGEFEHTRGGRKIYNGSTGAHCTTAFSVRQKSTGITGVLSAGHCGANMNRYDAEDSGMHNRVEKDYALSHKSTRMGAYGDFAWYTTTHWELPEYWASPTSMRSVTGWDLLPSVNEQVCVYSRMRSRRFCTRVHSIAVSVDWDCCPPFDNLVAATTNPTIKGDSGGPWSWNTHAYGVTSGWQTIGGVARSVYSEMFWLNSAFGNDIELLCDGVCDVKTGSQ